MQRARPAEAVSRALERFGKAEVFEHLEQGDGSLHRLEVHASGHGYSSCEDSMGAARKCAADFHGEVHRGFRFL